MAIKGILFDKDGTLIAFNDIFGGTYLRILQEHFGHSHAEATALLVATGYIPETGGCRGGSPMASETLGQIVKHWWPDLHDVEREARRKFIDENFDREAMEEATAIMELNPVLSALKQAGFVLGVATNDIMASAHSHMSQIGVVDHFHMLIGADSVEQPKPAGNMIRLFARETGLAPSEIAMVGDNAHDINEARAGGAGLAIGVLSGNSTQSDLAPIADHVISDVGELPSLLRRLA